MAAGLDHLRARYPGAETFRFGDSAALFGEVTWHATDRLYVTAGARGSYDRATIDAERADTYSTGYGFDFENGGQWSEDYDAFEQWDVADGSVDIYGDSSLSIEQNEYPGYGLHVDLDGSRGDAGTLTTKEAFTFEPGREYRLFFLLGKKTEVYASPTEATMTIALAGHQWSYVSPESEFYTDYAPQELSFTVDALTTSRLSFEHFGGDNRGFVIDDVWLRAFESGIAESGAIVSAPEPAMAALFLPVAAAFVVVGRRRGPQGSLSR